MSLGRIERLLAALGNPQQKLPPVVHVAGTNGKGSFLAFLRAIAEALGKGVHVYTSPHLVNFHERIVLAGPHGSAPIAEDYLVDCLARAEAANGGELITLFEITTAAAFLAFAETPADLLLLETGLGGRLDATNVVEQAAAHRDHADLDRPRVLPRRDPDRDRRREGRHLEARRALRGRPARPEAFAVIERRAEEIGAPLHVAGRDFDMYEQHGRLVFQTTDAADRSAAAAPQRAPSDRQCRHGHRRRQPRLRRCAHHARARARTHPRRMAGAAGAAGRRRLHAYVADGTEIWLDGGHNAAGGQVIAHTLAELDERVPRPVHLICGMMETKDAHAFIAPFKGLVERVYTVPIPDEPNAFDAESLAEIAKAEGFDVVATASVPDALTRSQAALDGPGRVLICGSLYLAGHVLKLHG